VDKDGHDIYKIVGLFLSEEYSSIAHFLYNKGNRQIVICEKKDNRIWIIVSFKQKKGSLLRLSREFSNAIMEANRDVADLWEERNSRQITKKQRNKEEIWKDTGILR
jgi:hypothetical protein